MKKTLHSRNIRRSLIPLILISVTVLQNSFAQTPILSFNSVVGGFSQPVDIVNAGDGSNRLFIVEKAGKIKIYSGGSILPTPFLDITDSNLVSRRGGEQGLLSVAFHPDYEDNGYFFIFYTRHNANAALDGDLEISRYKVSANPALADPLSRKVVLTIPHRTYTNHNGGKLNFGHDGSLYLSTGDGGDRDDPDNNGQSTGTLLGKIIRILVNDSTDVAPYYQAPTDNPYYSVIASRPEIFAIGLRNPFRWSFDRNGPGPWDMWIGDVGQGAWEEINFRPAGTQKSNFGWRCYEGRNNTPGLTPCSPVPPDTVNPVHQYNIGATGRAVTGGIVYRGSAYPALQGWYTAIDFYSGNAWLIRDRNTAAQMQSGLPAGIAAFGENESREIYAVNLNNGSLYQLQVTGLVPLKLISFEAQDKDRQHLITWKTAMEENMLRFEVQMSSDGVHFTTIHSAAARNKPNGDVYFFSYPASNYPEIYYRLSMIDRDGKITYSNTLHLKGKSPGVLILPNVIKDNKINIVSATAFNRLQLIDMNGRVRLDLNKQLPPGRNTIELHGLTEGSYIVRLYNNDGYVNLRVIVGR